MNNQYYINTPERSTMRRLNFTPKTEPDERNLSPKQDYYDFLTYGDKILEKTGLSRYSLSGKSIESTLSTEAEYTPQKTIFNSSSKKSADHPSSDYFRELTFENKKLKADIASLEIREKFFQSTISNLEREKSLLIEALDKAQSKMKDYSSRIKEEKKKNASFNESIRSSVVLDKISNTKCIQTETGNEESSKPINFSPFMLELKDLLANPEVNSPLFKKDSENLAEIREETPEGKTEIEDLRKYIELLKKQAGVHEEVRLDLIEKNNQLIKENKNIKLFLKSIRQGKQKDTESENASSDTHNMSPSKLTIKVLPSYIKAISMAIENIN